MVDGRELRLSNVDRLVFPDDGITKGEVVDYHAWVAEILLPHVRRRPLTMVRYRAGLVGDGFFQKEAGRGTPPWVARASVPIRTGTLEQVTCDDAATLVWLANQNALTLHVAPVRAPQVEHPDLLVFDFDPPAGEVANVVLAARLASDALGDVGLVPFVKSSGSKGLHVVAPLDGSAHRDEVAAFADVVAAQLVGAAPDRLTSEFRKDKREGRVLVDVARNRHAQTLVAPYSVRALPGAPVSAPLAWDELDPEAFDPRAHTLRSLPGRIDAVGDLWKDMAGQARPLPDAPEPISP